MLYVDDVAARVAQMQGIIGSEGHDLITVPSGELGIDVARACQPDLVILDMALPRMTGVELIARLRAFLETTAIPIIALSSDPCGCAPGLSMYCRRPLDLAGFSRLLRALLGPQNGGVLPAPRARHRPAASAGARQRAAVDRDEKRP